MTITKQITRIKSEVDTQTETLDEIETALKDKTGKNINTTELSGTPIENNTNKLQALSTTINTLPETKNLSMITATTNDVLASKIIVDTNCQPITGTMTDYSGKSVVSTGYSFNTEGVNFNITESGYYDKNTSYLFESYDSMGLSADKIAEGQSVLGLTGTYKGADGYLVKFASGSYGNKVNGIQFDEYLYPSQKFYATIDEDIGTLVCFTYQGVLYLYETQAQGCLTGQYLLDKCQRPYLKYDSSVGIYIYTIQPDSTYSRSNGTVIIPCANCDRYMVQTAYMSWHAYAVFKP